MRRSLMQMLHQWHLKVSYLARNTSLMLSLYKGKWRVILSCWKQRQVCLLTRVQMQYKVCSLHAGALIYLRMDMQLWANEVWFLKLKRKYLCCLSASRYWVSVHMNVGANQCGTSEIWVNILACKIKTKQNKNKNKKKNSLHCVTFKQVCWKFCKQQSVCNRYTQVYTNNRSALVTLHVNML